MPDRSPSPRPPARLKVRRAPNVWAFVATGAVVGFVLGAVVDLFTPATPGYSTVTTVAYFGALGLVVGALAGGALAVLLDRRS